MPEWIVRLVSQACIRHRIAKFGIESGIAQDFNLFIGHIKRSRAIGRSRPTEEDFTRGRSYLARILDIRKGTISVELRIRWRRSSRAIQVVGYRESVIANEVRIEGDIIQNFRGKIKSG